MECKSCGSVKFRRLSHRLFECEYCGREVEISDVLRVDNPMNNMFIDDFGCIMLNPTRTISLQPVVYAEKITDCQEKLQDLAKQNKKLKNGCLSIRKAIKRMIES